MKRYWCLVLVVCCLNSSVTAYQRNVNNKRLNRVSLHELRQVIRDDLVGVVENALVSMEMGRTASGGMRIDERITTSVEASVRTMTNGIQETLRRFETRLMTIENHLGGGDPQQARSRSQQDFLCSEAHERSLQQGVERITSILGSVTERIGEARDAGSAAEQGVARLNERVPAIEDNMKSELKHSVSVIENSVKRQIQSLGLNQAAAAAAAHDTRSPSSSTCSSDSILSAFKRMESSLTWQLNKVENVLTRMEEGAGTPSVSRPSRRDLDTEAAQEVEPYARSPGHLASCAALKSRGFSVSGLYFIRPAAQLPRARVFCDMTTAGGGWTVFQRRGPHLKRTSFFRDWDSYKTGFGEASGEYWLGLDYIHALTGSGTHKLRIEMLDWDGKRKYVEYDRFNVSDEDDKYRIQLGAFSGNTGDSMTADNSRQFSTRDQDNDVLRYGSCARAHKAGWWFGACRRANLNGVSHNGTHSGPDGINWLDWKGPNYSLKAARMLLK